MGLSVGLQKGLGARPGSRLAVILHLVSLAAKGTQAAHLLAYTPYRDPWANRCGVLAAWLEATMLGIVVASQWGTTGRIKDAMFYCNVGAVALPMSTMQSWVSPVAVAAAASTPPL